MEHWFELWDAENASLVGTYETQAGALDIVRRTLASFGPKSVESLVLTMETNDDADPRVIAAGAELADLTRQEAPAFAGVGRGQVDGNNGTT